MTNINEQNTAAVSVKYNGSTIAEIGVGGKETLDCVGKCMKSNVEISCVMEEYSGDVTVIEVSGLYDTNDNLLVSWADSGIDAEKNYTSSTYLTDPTSPYYVITNNYSTCRKVIIDNSLTSIGEMAFRNCSSLTSITIQGGVTSIGNYAFWYCSSLTSITIPDSVTSIGGVALGECRSLSSIDFAGTKAQWKTIAKGNNWNIMTGNYVVHCTDGDIP